MKKNVGLLVLIALFVCQSVFAQQTIISIPSSDVLPVGDIILKESNKINPFGDSSSYQLTPTVIFGSGFNTETSIGLSSSIASKTARTGLKLNLATKKVFYLGKKTRFTVGTQISPNLNLGKNPDTMIYSHFNYRIKKTKTSVTSGMYASGKNSAPSNLGAVIGIDQVILPNKLRIAADYMTRTDSLGSFNVGFKYRPVPDLSITTAISLPTCEEQKVGFIISFSKYVGNIKDVYADIKKEEKGEL